MSFLFSIKLASRNQCILCVQVIMKRWHIAFLDLLDWAPSRSVGPGLDWGLLLGCLQSTLGPTAKGGGGVIAKDLFFVYQMQFFNSRDTD